MTWFIVLVLISVSLNNPVQIYETFPNYGAIAPIFLNILRQAFPTLYIYWGAKFEVNPESWTQLKGSNETNF